MRDLLLFSVIFAVLVFSQTQSERSPVCDQPSDQGTGDNLRIYMYYNSSTDKCELFRYFGMGGNGNRFTSEKYCMRNCSSKAEEIYPMDESKSCLLKKAPGDCLGTNIRFYYDAVHQKCKSFYWTGCNGNGNRFFDLQQCNATCAGKSADGDEPEELEHDTPVALILGVIFGILGAIILIVVIVVAVKAKPANKKHKEGGKGAARETPLADAVEMS